MNNAICLALEKFWVVEWSMSNAIGIGIGQSQEKKMIGWYCLLPLKNLGSRSNPYYPPTLSSWVVSKLQGLVGKKNAINFNSKDQIFLNWFCLVIILVFKFINTLS